MSDNKPQVINQKIDPSIEAPLGKPVADELSENTLRIRRNLIVYCSIILFSYYFKIEVSGENVNIFGIPFNGVTTENIYNALFLIILYNSIHFSIMVVEYISYVKIHLTGVYKLLNRPISPPYTAYYDHEESGTKQSTIFNLLINNNLKKLNNEDAVIEHLKVSFHRFDKYFFCFLKTQTFRIIILDLAFPLLLAFFALRCIALYNCYFDKILIWFDWNGKMLYIKALVENLS